MAGSFTRDSVESKFNRSTVNISSYIYDTESTGNISLTKSTNHAGSVGMIVFRTTLDIAGLLSEKPLICSGQFEGVGGWFR